MGSRIRRAATVIAARPGEGGGVDVLMLRRSPHSRFLPGYVVFPGGAVDPDDDVLAARWFGDPGEAPRAAAIRELIEEAGLALTSSGLVAVLDPNPAAGIAAVDAAPPPVEALRQVAHWVAPDDVPVRFDARNFALAARRGVEPVPDAVEAEAAWWADPRSLLRAWAGGEEKLYWPTMKTVEALAEAADVDALLRLDIPDREPEPGDEDRMPRSTFYQSEEEWEQARRTAAERPT